MFPSDPVQSLFAIGTKSGQVVLFGQDSIQVQFHLPRPIKIKMLKFYNEFLCIIDSAETLFVYDYQILAKGIPTKYASLTLRGEVT